MDVLDKLIRYLENKLEEVPRYDDWNYETHLWSRGFKKGCEYMLNLAKLFREYFNKPMKL